MSQLPQHQRGPGQAPGQTQGQIPGESKPYLRIYFKCANQYVRVYRRPEDPEYVARCPTCGQQKRFRVGRSGTAQRFFELSCK